MADSKFDICNQALVLVGANTITSFTESTTESKVASQLYESTLENLLTRCRWRFSTKQEQLSRKTNSFRSTSSSKDIIGSTDGCSRNS